MYLSSKKSDIGRNPGLSKHVNVRMSAEAYLIWLLREGTYDGFCLRSCSPNMTQGEFIQLTRSGTDPGNLRPGGIIRLRWLFLEDLTRYGWRDFCFTAEMALHMHMQAINCREASTYGERRQYGFLGDSLSPKELDELIDSYLGGDKRRKLLSDVDTWDRLEMSDWFAVHSEPASGRNYEDDEELLEFPMSDHGRDQLIARPPPKYPNASPENIRNLRLSGTGDVLPRKFPVSEATSASDYPTSSQSEGDHNPKAQQLVSSRVTNTTQGTHAIDEQRVDAAKVVACAPSLRWKSAEPGAPGNGVAMEGSSAPHDDSLDDDDRVIDRKSDSENSHPPSCERTESSASDTDSNGVIQAQKRVIRSWKDVLKGRTA